MLDIRLVFACVSSYAAEHVFCSVPLDEARRAEMFDLLAALRGRLLLSFDDRDEIRRLAKRHKFRLREAEVCYTLSAKASARTKRPELLVANFDLAASHAPSIDFLTFPAHAYTVRGRLFVSGVLVCRLVGLVLKLGLDKLRSNLLSAYGQSTGPFAAIQSCPER